MNDYRAYARSAAKRAGIDPDIFGRQIDQESKFNPNARSPAGAVGIAQFMPGTAEALGIDPTDPYASLDGAATWMSQLLQQYGGRWDLALAAYNAGPGAVQKYGGVPPYEETQRYVAAILGPSGTGIAAGTGETPTSTSVQGGGNMVARSAHGTYEGAGRPGMGSAGPVQTDPRLDELFRIKGSPVSVRRVSQDIKPPDWIPGEPLLPNPEPAYEYAWEDGTSVKVVGNQESGYTITGTALKALDQKAAAASVRQDDQTMPDGSVWRVDVSNPQAPVPLYQVKPAAQPKYQMGSQSGQFIPIFDPTTGTTKWRPSPTYYAAERTQTELENERLRRSMQPLGAQQMKDLAAQQQQIQALLASGDIDVETANKLMDAARKNISATMRGTTLFQQEQADEQNRQERLSRAGQLIGTKLAQSSGLASSFLGSALSGAGNAMMPVGKTTLGLDPLALARNYSASQGGDELARLAALLTGGAGGGGGEMSEEEYASRMAGLQGAK